MTTDAASARRLRDRPCTAARPGAPASASAKCAAEANRSAGSFANALASAASITADTSPRTTASRIGGSVSSFAMMACAVGPVCGGSPASISYSTAAREYTSLRASRWRSPVACSGLM